MTYMTSSAAVGSASVTIYFRQGTNADWMRGSTLIFR